MNPFLPCEPEYLEQLRTRIPDALDVALSKAAEQSLAVYAAGLRSPREKRPPLQDGEDLVVLAAAEARRLLPAGSAEAVTRALENDFCALTANHHGADFHPEFVQGTLLFSLARLEDAAVPVFACGGVPRHNVGYPRGILLGRGEPYSTKPRRFPVLPDKNRQALISVQPPFSAADAERALRALPDKGLPPNESSIVARLLTDVFAAPSVLAQTCYRDQATVMNSLLWPRLFGPGIRPPRLISLDMQYLSGRLAARDLTDSGSLLHALALEPPCALAVYRALNGARGCWQVDDPDAPRPRAMRGTFLVWALDEAGRPAPMALHPSGQQLLAVGRPDLDVPLTPDALTRGLTEHRLLPGLYLYFAVAALARGLTCCGGVYQTGYLRAMAKGTAEALHACGEQAMADGLRVCSPWSTGFLPLKVRPGDGGWPPGGYAASPVDIIGYGGLGTGELNRLGAMTMGEAFAAALAYQYEDLVPEGERIPRWQERLGVQAGLYLSFSS